MVILLGRPGAEGQAGRQSAGHVHSTNTHPPGPRECGRSAAETVDGFLKVPENVQHVGWWDGSAQAGEPFGATVIAGHVDSAAEGIGFFARLLQIKVGEHGHAAGRLAFAEISGRSR